jgi:hypothetical protein
MARKKGDFNFSANFEVKKKATLDARQYVDNYTELFEFTADDYIPFGFPVTVGGLDDPSKLGTWYCVNPNDLASPLSWVRANEPVPFNQVIQVGSFSFDDTTYEATLGATLDWGFNEDGVNYIVGEENITLTAPDLTYSRADIIVWSSVSGYQSVEGVAAEDFAIPNTPVGTILVQTLIRNVDGSVEPTPPDLSIYAKLAGGNTFTGQQFFTGTPFSYSAIFNGQVLGTGYRFVKRNRNITQIPATLSDWAIRSGNSVEGLNRVVFYSATSVGGGDQRIDATWDDEGKFEFLSAPTSGLDPVDAQDFVTKTYFENNTPEGSFSGLTGDPYDNTLLATALDAKADSNNVVDLTTDQEIDGVKTFLNEVNVNSIVYADGLEVNGNTNTESLNATGSSSISSSGSVDTLTVNHSSGSGKAVVINKAGNGEGLLINKTSGSGNALTVVGDLEATNIKRTGGASSQFLKADGSVDSTAYQPALTNPLTGTGTTNFLPKFTGTSSLGNSQIFDNGVSVGIGTISTSRPLTVEAGANYLTSFFKGGLLSGGNYFSSILVGYQDNLINQSVQFGYSYNPTNPSLSFAHITPFGSVEGSLFRFQANGNFGIGTTAPTELLHVNGTARATRLGLGLASNTASHLALAANTTTIGQTLMTPSAVDYTGTVSGMFWNNTSEIKFYDGVLAGVNRLVKTSGNQVFAGAGNVGIVGNNLGDLGTVPIVERLQSGIITRTSNYTVALTDVGANGTVLVRADATAGNITITLPTAASSTGITFIVKKVDSSVNTVTVSVASNIDGSTTKVYNTQYTGASIMSNGTDFNIVSAF